jgi:hypothetical protein
MSLQGCATGFEPGVLPSAGEPSNGQDAQFYPSSSAPRRKHFVNEKSTKLSCTMSERGFSSKSRYSSLSIHFRRSRIVPPILWVAVRMIG